jgi:predicted RNase H-like HicB family nuclease
VVERLAPGVYEVEFSDDDGRTYATLSLRADELLQLHHEAEPSGRSIEPAAEAMVSSRP